jgi:hypothetical protein
MDWLRNVHGIDTVDAVAAILFGNEDAPERVEVYLVDDYRSTPIVWLGMSDGKMVKQNP